MLNINLATWDYDRVRPIIENRIKIEGCSTTYHVLPPEECFHRAYILNEFEVSEIGFIPYIVAKSQNLTNYTAIPVFLSRMFRHSCIYIRKDRNIFSPEALINKNVGVVEYQMSAATWCRGMLFEEYGVHPSQMRWHQGGVNQEGRVEKFPLNLEKDFPLEKIPAGMTLSEMLENGDLDAIISPEAPNCFKKDNQIIGRLFEDFEKEEKKYYRKTKHFPIMHAVGIRNDILAEHPWLPKVLVDAFTQAKNIAEQDLRELRALKIGLPWIVAHTANTEKLMGSNFWAYGVQENKNTLKTILNYTYEQGLSKRKLSIDELFVT